MKIVAIAMAYNEADVIGETVTEALGWVDHFVVHDHGSLDGTPDIAEAAGATVIRGEPGEYHEGLRQCTLDVAAMYDPDWIVRIDADEMYHHDPSPRAIFERAHQGGAACVRALQAEFWLTLHDIRHGAILEDPRVSVKLRRRWYTIGHTALIGWRHRADLRYYEDTEIQQKHNVPLDPQHRAVHELGPVWAEQPLQLHYNSRSVGQVMGRMVHRPHNLWIFGKYRYNIIIDETVASLHYLGPDDRFNFRDNHDRVYEWYRQADLLYQQRAEVFGWEAEP